MAKGNFSFRSLHGQVVREMGQRIVRGDYLPGSVLPTEEKLCQTLKVSRTALREAIKMLTAKGLVEARPKVGTRVRPRADWNVLDPDVLNWRCATMRTDEFARNLMEMREIIEPAAAVLAARHRTAKELVVIEEAYTAMADSNSLEQWVNADLAFHRALLNGSHNELLVPFAHLIEAALGTLLAYSARVADNMKVSLGEHKRVLQAVRDRNEKSAFDAMSLLLSNTRRNLAKSLASATNRPLHVDITTGI